MFLVKCMNFLFRKFVIIKREKSFFKKYQSSEGLVFLFIELNF